MAPLGSRGKKGGYAPVSVADSADSSVQPVVAGSSHQLSGHNAMGEVDAHWSGLSPEQARNFPGCPSNRVLFPEYDVGFFTCLLRFIVLVISNWYWSYQWMTPLMKLGNRCHLQDSDVWAIHPKEACYTNGPPMREKWQKEQSAAKAASREPTIGWPIFYTVRRNMAVAGCGKLLGDGFKLLNPFVLRQILLVVEGNKDAIVEADKAYLLALVLFITTWLQVVIDQRYQYYVQRIGFRTQCAMISVLYRQILELTPGARAAYSSGKIANLMSTDCAKVQTVVAQFNHLWLVPVHFILALSLLIWTVGPAGFAGLATTLLLIPLGKKLVAKLKNIRKDALKCTDERLKLTQEALSGIRIVKFMTWEQSLTEKIDRVRAKELALLRVAAIYKALNFTLMASSPMIICITTLSVYGALGGALTASTAFTAFSLLNILKQPIEMMPNVITDVFVDGKVSMARLTTFLSEPGMARYVEPIDSAGRNGDLVLNIQGASFAWQPLPQKIAWSGQERSGGRRGGSRGGGGMGRGDGKPKQKSDAEKEAERLLQKAKEGQGRPVLTDISLSVKRGHLCCIVGGVGCGKSSLIHGILGEMALTPDGGRVCVDAKLSYAPQSAFTLNDTVRSNVLLGLPFVQKHYDEVVDACALRSDFAQLPSGDLSQIGENGINLSGGQKQRIGLARAVYAAVVGDAEMLLLDDPLSAVDAHVGAHIFDQCINGLLRSRHLTVIMPVHNLQFLQRADHVVCLHQTNGTITEQGSYLDLIQAGGEFAKMMETFASVSSKDGEVTPTSPTRAAELLAAAKVHVGGSTHKAIKRLYHNLKEDPDSLVIREAIKLAEAEEMDGEHKDDPATASDAAKVGGEKEDTQKKEKKTEKQGKLMTVEERAVGGVDRGVWLYYATTCGLTLSWVVFFCYIGGMGAKVLTDWWMSRWSVDDTSVLIWYDESWTLIDRTVGFLFVYGMLGVIVVVLNGIKTVVVCVIGLKAARTLHSNMLQSLLCAPTSFFDQTPVGRILNRFSSDMQSIDMGLTDQFIAFAEQLFTLIGVFAVILVVYLPFLVFVPPLFMFYGNMQRRYRNASRELKRLNSISKSPIFSHFQESLAGLTVVRAYGVTDQFIAKSDDNVNNNMRFQLVGMTAGRWMTFQLNFSAACIVGVVAMSIALNHETVDPGTTGLALTYAMLCTRTLGMIIRFFTDLELQMNSIERVKYYIDCPREALFDKPQTDPGPQWPRQASVAFNDVCARYRPGLPFVVKDLTFSVRPGQKVGVVGRTGAGKSSVMLLLFRILELERGKIEIDGVNIAALGLRRLRKAIAMLPQDPTLFAGTVRNNLDPFGEASDTRVWEALRRAQMEEAVNALPNGLDSEVGEGGSAFSVGQRQLLCLARAVLRNSKLLIMDECTASVDVATDSKIQEMIREVFSQCTIFAIAHRLATIIDYDKILVMERGEIQETGHPAELLRDPGSALSALVDQSGPSMAAYLRAAAHSGFTGK